METRWAKGIFLGVREESGEYMVGTATGCLECSTVKRRGTPAERWCIEEFNAMRGTPWRPNPDSADTELRSRVVMPDDIKVPTGPIGNGNGVETVEQDAREVFRGLGADLV